MLDQKRFNEVYGWEAERVCVVLLQIFERHANQVAVPSGAARDSLDF
jgi:hypothetical protein